MRDKPVIESEELASMRFGVLGPLQLWHGGRWVGVTAAKQRSLLAVLLLKGNQAVSAEWLIEQLWGEGPPATATNQLQVHVSRLRRLLGDRAGLPLVTQAPGYRLAVQPGELDLDRFEELVADGRRALGDGALDDAERLLGQALGLWRGAALADVPGGGLVDSEAARLEECRLLAMEDRLEVGLRRGRHSELVAELRALVAQHPFRERLWALLLLALYRSGRQADALKAYGYARASLVEELGIEPGAELQRLQRQILEGDPSLGMPPALTEAAADPASAADRSGPVPRQLPADIATFTGRQRELAQLEQVLDDAGASGPMVISAVDGAGGIGKSALAIHAAHRLAERFPDGQLYLNLQGATAGLAPLEPMEALSRLLRALGVSSHDIPTQVDEAAAAFRSVIAGRQLLLVLDNARDAAQVRPLLPGGPTCGVLVTSRQVLVSLEGAHALHLDVLPQQQALELLARVAGPPRVAAEPQAAAAVVDRCGGLPLAIQIAGARLAARPTWPVRVLADRLADATRRLEELEVDQLAVRASFEVSLQVLSHRDDSIDQAAASAFGLLSLPDGPDLGLPAAARLLDLSPEQTERMLERLVDARLLDSPTPGRYQFHDLLRLYAREHATRQYSQPQRTAALVRLLELYTVTAWQTARVLQPGSYRVASADSRWTDIGVAFADAAAAFDWLEAERANLLTTIA